MGQANLPMLNRAGESIYWASNNENFFNPVRNFSEGYFFQMFFSLFLSNKASNFFFFFFFKYFLTKRVSIKKILKGKLLFKVKRRFYIKKKLSNSFKNKKRIFLFNTFFFTKVFLISYYNYIIISIKIFYRHKKKKNKRRKHKFYLILFLWKLFFLNNYLYTVDKNIFFRKKF